MGVTTSDGATRVLALFFVVLTAFLLWWFTLQVRRGKKYVFRRLPALEKLRDLLVLATESGKVVHLSLGSSGLVGAHTAIVSTGLAILRYLADQGVSLKNPPIVTVADPTVMIAAQDVLYRTHERAGLVQSYRSTAVQMIASDSAAYAVGAQDMINDQDVMGNVMIGNFGQEYLLLGETGAQRGIVQIVGSDAITAHPFMVATSDDALLGEEVFAASAYLSDRPAHAASLRLQDWLRVLIAVVTVIGVLFATVFGRV